MWYIVLFIVHNIKHMTTHLFDDDGRYWRGGDVVLVKYKCTRTIKPSSSRSIEYLREPELCIYIIFVICSYENTNNN